MMHLLWEDMQAQPLFWSVFFFFLWSAAVAWLVL